MLCCRSWLAALAAAAAIVALSQAAFAVTIHDEAVNGDLSGNRFAPTALALGVGTGTIIGSTVRGDIDYYSISLPVGAVLSELVLASFVSTDDVSFMAVQSGPTFTTPNDNPDVAVLLGYTHFGSGGIAETALVGTSILDELGLGEGAIGFRPPLARGTYTFWVQQLQTNLVSYRFDYVVVPEPSTGALVALGFVSLAIARRRS